VPSGSAPGKTAGDDATSGDVRRADIRGSDADLAAELDRSVILGSGAP
jgi:hypothetical protein